MALPYVVKQTPLCLWIEKPEEPLISSPSPSIPGVVDFHSIVPCCEALTKDT